MLDASQCLADPVYLTGFITFIRETIFSNIRCTRVTVYKNILLVRTLPLSLM